MKKRVELSIHTSNCSKLGINCVEEYIREAVIAEMPAIAITDTVSVQSYPTAFDEAKKHGIKLIYGIELFQKKAKILFRLQFLLKTKQELKKSTRFYQKHIYITLILYLCHQLMNSTVKIFCWEQAYTMNQYTKL